MSDETTPAKATVTVRIESLTREELVGQTVAQIRENFGDVLTIPEDATPMVDGNVVDEDYELQAGDKLNFSLPVGSKG